MYDGTQKTGKAYERLDMGGHFHVVGKRRQVIAQKPTYHTAWTQSGHREGPRDLESYLEGRRVSGAASLFGNRFALD